MHENNREKSLVVGGGGAGERSRDCVSEGGGRDSGVPEGGGCTRAQGRTGDTRRLSRHHHRLQLPFSASGS